jgi:hypothetical protein
MGRSLRSLVGLLRGDDAWVVPLRRGEIVLDTPGVAAWSILLVAAYGLGIGTFGVMHGVGSWPIQLVASAVKIPVVVLLVFALTCPLFIAACAFGGLGLSAGSAFRFCVATFAAFATVLGALTPVTTVVSVVCNYSFTTLINLAFFAAAGLGAATFVFRTVGQLACARAGSDGRRRPIRAWVALAAWCIAFGLIGLQIGWRMRPLIGWRDVPFRWYRADEMSLWDGIVSEIYNILIGGGV